jgi:capsular exopolysaccharide synthesis family protein
LEDQYAKYDKTIQEKRRTLDGIARTVGQDAQTVAHAQRFAQDHLGQLYQQQQLAETDLRRAQVQFAALPDKEPPVSDAAVEEIVQRDQEVVRLAGEVAQHEAAYEAAKRSINATTPQGAAWHQRYRDGLATARAAHAGRVKAQRAVVTEQLRSRVRGDWERAREQAQIPVKIAENWLDLTNTRISLVEKQSEALRNGSISVESLRDQIETADEYAKAFGRQIQALTIELLADSRFSILEESFVSSAEGEKRRLMAAGGAAVAGLGLVVAGFTWLELRTRRIGTVVEVQKNLGVRLLGVLPSWSRRAGGASLDRAAAGQHLLIEAIDATRTILLSAAGAGAARCIMVTSATSGEGKTSLSCHLATSLARAGYRTLLIDGDLRRPSVHQLFGLPLGVGLSEVLRGEAAPAAAVRPTPLSTLAVLTAGQCTEQSLQGLARDRARDVFAALRERYDYVIVDTSPVLPVADALLIGRHVDGAVFSLLRDVSRVPAVLAAQERLGMVGVPVLGAVVSGVSGDVYSSHYGYAAPAAEPAVVG